METILNNVCGGCLHWINLPKVPYNNIHKKMKQCGCGHVITGTSRCCVKFEVYNTKETKPKLKRRRDGRAHRKNLHEMQKLARKARHTLQYESD